MILASSASNKTFENFSAALILYIDAYLGEQICELVIVSK